MVVVIVRLGEDEVVILTSPATFVVRGTSVRNEIAVLVVVGAPPTMTTVSVGTDVKDGTVVVVGNKTSTPGERLCPIWRLVVTVVVRLGTKEVVRVSPLSKTTGTETTTEMVCKAGESTGKGVPDGDATIALLCVKLGTLTEEDVTELTKVTVLMFP